MRFWPKFSLRRKRPRQSRSLRFESLEARMMLAANLLDSVDDAGGNTLDPNQPFVTCGGLPAENGGNLVDGFLDAYGNRYFEESLFENQQAAGEGGQTGVSSGAIPLDETFSLHSNPGANHTIYLDFDGNVTSGTYWNSSFNNGQDIVTPAYSFEGDSSSFTDNELDRIQRIWRWVSEDYLPFDVDVTTEDPGVAALTKSSTSDTDWGVRVVIGPNTFYDPAGGVAYLNSFNWSTDTPAFVFNTSELGIAEAASHEVGHTLGLRHDGQNPGDGEYYYGQGSGTTGWAPIMGVGYYQNLTQWSRGEYPNATNTEDDLYYITTLNGFGYRPDDHGNTGSTATPLYSNSGVLGGQGIIEQNSDYDVFSFTTSGGPLSIDVNPFDYHPNLDILAQLYTSDGSLVASSNPIGALDAHITATLDADTYYLWISGVGEGDPLETGYSDYGSLGFYSISATGSGTGDDTTAPSGLLNADDIATAGGATQTFTVTYSDNVAVDVSGLDSADLIVTGPAGYAANATFLSVDVASNGTPRVATYEIAAPGGTWDSDDNGQYTVSLRSNQVGDTNGNFAAAGALGTFYVQLAASDRLESNNSFAEAADLGSGDRTENGLSIHSSDDEDYFKWVAPDSGTLSVDVLFQHADGDLDLFVYGPDMVALEHSLSVTDNESVTVSVTAGDTYYVHVYGYNGATNPQYDLVLDGPDGSPPVADAGGPYSGVEGSDISLDGASSTGGAGTIVAYDWDLDGDGQYDDASGATATFNTGVDGTYSVGLRVTDSLGATSTDTASVTVSNAAPTANAGGPYEVEVGSSVTLDATGSSDPGNDIVSYQWDFDGDGQYDDATGTNPEFNALSAGDFAVGLKVTDDDGSSSTATATVTVNEAPAANGPALLTGLTTTDEATAVDGWNTITLEHSYQSMVVVATPNYKGGDPGVVRVRNAAGNRFEIQVVTPDGGTISGVDVYYMVVEEGSYTQADDGIKMEAVKFTSSSTDSKGSWNGQQQSYINAYTDPVVFGQVMTANDPNWSVFWSRGSSRTAPASSSELYVGKHAGEDNSLPKASEEIGYLVFEAGIGTVGNFSFEVGVGSDIVRGLTNNPPYEYNHSLSSPTSAIVTQAAMDGQDGSWALLYGDNPVGPDTISVSLDEDQIGDSERYHTTEQLSYIVFQEFSTANESPTAVVGGSYNGVEGSAVAFDGSASFDTDGQIVGYQWDFGDGSTGSGAQANHTYSDNGNYQVTLTVIDDQGATASDTSSAVVSNVAPEIEAGANQSANEGGSVDFAGSIADPGSDTFTIQWDFGDGSTASGLSTSHVFATEGMYNVTLTVTDDDGGVATDGLVVTVTDLDPTASFSSSASNPTVGQEVTFTDTSTSYDGIVNWQWDFDGDGTTDSTLQNPTYAFDTARSYNVRLTVTEADNDQHSVVEAIQVSGVPAPSPHLVYGQVTSGNESWTTVSLSSFTSHVYEDLVLVATPLYDSAAQFQDSPTVVRIRNVSGTSFEFQTTDVSSGDYVAGVSVYFVAVEAGVYNQVENGITMEAGTFLSTTTNSKGSWVGQEVGYQQSYTSPVVFGQVMTSNDAQWSTFWNSGSSRTSPPTASSLRIGKMVGEDPNKSRADETLGYIVFEDNQAGSIDGVDYEVGLGDDIVRGFGNTSTGFAYTHGLSNASAAILTQAGMDGQDGSWAALYGGDAITSDTIRMVADEDTLGDAERYHTTEQFAYLALGNSANLPSETPANSPTSSTSVSTADVDRVFASIFGANQSTLWSREGHQSEFSRAHASTMPTANKSNVAPQAEQQWSHALSSVIAQFESSPLRHHHAGNLTGAVPDLAALDQLFGKSAADSVFDLLLASDESSR